MFKIAALQGDSGSGSACFRQVRSRARSSCCLRSPQLSAVFRPDGPLQILKILLFPGDSDSGVAFSRGRGPLLVLFVVRGARRNLPNFGHRGCRAPQTSKSTLPGRPLSRSILTCDSVKTHHNGDAVGKSTSRFPLNDSGVPFPRHRGPLLGLFVVRGSLMIPANFGPKGCRVPQTSTFALPGPSLCGSVLTCHSVEVRQNGQQ